jgi:hypothetical protein
MKPYAVTIRILSFETLVVQADSAEQAAKIGHQEWLQHPRPHVEPSSGYPYTVRPLEPLSQAFAGEGFAESIEPLLPSKEAKGK